MTNPNVRFVAGGVKTASSTGPGLPSTSRRPPSQSSVEAQGTPSADQRGPGDTDAQRRPVQQFVHVHHLAAGEQPARHGQPDQQQQHPQPADYASIDPVTNTLNWRRLPSAPAKFHCSSSSLGSGGTGIGAGTTTTTGVDVAGTINGEPATGIGADPDRQPGNSTTEALSLIVSATTPGSYGSLRSRTASRTPWATRYADRGRRLTAGSSWRENSLNTQITNAQQQITQHSEPVTPTRPT